MFFKIKQMGKISDNQLRKIKDFYYRDMLSMREIASNFGVSIDAVVYFMRRHDLKRRGFSEINKLRFEKKKPSFKERPINSVYKRELRAIGSMLYWGEGYKSEKSSFVDFSNSDSEMIKMFLKYLRGVYHINEKKLRVLLYCYSNQNIDELIKYWSELTKIPINQFTKPYIRRDYNVNSRRMKRGLVHIRYIDKKLLLNIRGAIDFYKRKFLGR